MQLTVNLFCQLLFRILTKEKLIELPDRPVKPGTKRKIVPSSTQSLQTEVGSNSSSKGFPRKKTTPFREEGVFKRISYVHQTLISQAPKSSSDQDKLAEVQPLHEAAIAGDVATVQAILKAGSSINSQDEYYGRVLQAACSSVEHNGTDLVLYLLTQENLDVNLQGGNYCTALQAASVVANETVLKLLLQHGADLEAEEGFYGAALEAAAAYYGHTDSEDSTLLLLKNGADVNALGGEYDSSLHVVVYKGKTALAQLLLDHEADIGVQDDLWGTSLQAAVSTIYSDGEQVAHMLVERGADINALSGEYGSALHAAAFQGKEELVDYLLEKGANPDLELEDGSTTLHVAARNGHFGVVKLLTEE